MSTDVAEGEYSTSGKFLSIASGATPKLNDSTRAEKEPKSGKKRGPIEKWNGRVGGRRRPPREMEIVETFSGRQEGRRVKHKFREGETSE